MFGCYFINLLGWGNLICFLFLAINFYGSANEKNVEKVAITEWSSQRGGKGRRNKRLPVFTINYKDLKKEFVFTHQYYANRAAYKTIVLTTQKGFLGYTTIKDKELLFAVNTE